MFSGKEGDLSEEKILADDISDGARRVAGMRLFGVQA